MTVQRVPGGSRGKSVAPFLRRLISLVGRLAYRLGANRSKTLLLTTVGARSGREYTSPVAYFPDGADAWLVVASMGGDRRHPAWYHNLVANPNRASVQVAGRQVPVRATSLHGPERVERWERIVATSPNFSEYQRATDREIPVLRLEAAR
jgi:deazaflavin-dependent oxidoreductase (nitroreductase family)